MLFLCCFASLLYTVFKPMYYHHWMTSVSFTLSPFLAVPIKGQGPSQYKHIFPTATGLDSRHSSPKSSCIEAEIQSLWDALMSLSTEKRDAASRKTVSYFIPKKMSKAGNNVYKDMRTERSAFITSQIPP